jgi:adenosine deaminase
MQFLAQEGVVVETCPVSNVRTRVVPDIGSHPIRTFIEQGISVTVNSDDPSLFHTDMNNEYLQLHHQLGFTLEELYQISLNGVNNSFINEAKKNQLRNSFHKKYNSIQIQLE